MVRAAVLTEALYRRRSTRLPTGRWRGGCPRVLQLHQRQRQTAARLMWRSRSPPTSRPDGREFVQDAPKKRREHSVVSSLCAAVIAVCCCSASPIISPLCVAVVVVLPLRNFCLLICCCFIHASEPLSKFIVYFVPMCFPIFVVQFPFLCIAWESNMRINRSDHQPLQSS